MNETINDLFSKRLNQELDRVGVPSIARPKRLATLTNKSIPGARKWLVNNSIPRGGNLETICDEFGLDSSYIRAGIRSTSKTGIPDEVNVVLQSSVFVKIHEVAQRHGIDIHNPESVPVKTLEKAYKVLMKIAAKYPNEELDEDVILTLIK
jgi:AraC-like DNA-binding protein